MLVHFIGMGYKDEKSLLQSFDLVIGMHQSLKPR